MSVTAQTPVISYTASGTATVFPYPYLILLAGDMSVYANSVLVTTGYTVSGAGVLTGGNVTFTTAPVAGTIIKLLRAIPRTRSTDYIEGGALGAVVLNADIDRAILMVQDVRADAASLVQFDAAVTSVTNNVVIATTQAGIASTQASNSAASAVAAAASVAGSVARSSPTGSVVMPTGTTAQRDGTPVFGYARANSTMTRMEWWNGSSWTAMGGGATGTGSDTVFQENSTTVTASYTLTTGKNASVVGPLTINTGVTLTIPTGQRLVIL